MQMANGAAAARDGGVVGGGQVLGKRHADDSSLNDDQRFTKRFNLLSIRNSQANGNSNYYIPVANDAPLSDALSHARPLQPVRRAQDEDDLMQVDDTRDRVYIHNLDDELADIESDEEKLIFLPDIEKRLSRLPRQLLTGRRQDEAQNQELVLYSVPKSLTVDESHDAVRKAILEARQRARDKTAEEVRQEDMVRKYGQSEHAGLTETAHGYCGGYAGEEQEPVDPDAMDIG
ncbi:hypothetical protein LTR36_003065 [Oleoguttula mirabilis]|uniref:Uncharacterized protein n=1 Tax=Oleoguttula mirabilis TaxID=1507867 RepID=A0AAV9JZM8_9PEZI|nr:hypothetical protein LTR36_003065 [Oleoguttula mirabilis]